MKSILTCCHFALLLYPASIWSQSTTWPAQKPNNQLNDFLQRTGNVDIAWVAEYASGLNPGYYETSAIAVDSDGDIYVTGKGQSDSTSLDFATVKYTSAGIEQWVARYNGPDNLDDVATAITVDIEKNVYVTGSSGGGYATVKYDAAGIEQWSARYKSPGDFDEIPAAITVDSAGNIYVTGEGIAQTAGLNYESATVKYNSSGVQQWVIYHGFVGNGTVQHQVVKLAMDNSGNFYVAGPGFTPGTMIDFTTIKYNSNGIEQWRSLYTAPNAPSGAGDDFIGDLHIDQLGNIYVTGSSTSCSSPCDTIRSVYATVKYNSSGQEQWAARSNGSMPTDLTVDVFGNVLVTGSTGTVKYDPNGVEQWDVAGGMNIITDNQGDVYVASVDGDYFFTTKYSAASAVQWTAQEESKPVALAIDKNENIYVAGTLHSGLFSSYATASYNSAGLKLWTARYAQASGSSYDVPVAQVVDEAGNVYVTGWSLSSTLTDFATVKYDASGVQRWAARYNSPENGWDEPSALVIDKQGSIYVAGATGSGYATVKYNSDGVEQWATNRRNLLNYGEVPTDIAVDDDGNVYVTGDSYGENSVREYLTVKYNSDGAQQWEAHYKGLSNDQEDVPLAIGVDDFGNVYVTGRSSSADTQNLHDDFATIKYDATGAELWVARYNGSGTGISYDEATDLEVDAERNCYVTGQSNGEYATIKYDTDGNEQWVARFDGTPEGHTDMPTDLAVDKDGNVYVTGVGMPDNYGEYVTVKYDATGSLLWVARRRPGIEASLAIDKVGNVYVNGYDVTIKYDAQGREVGRVNEGGIGIGVDSTGGVYVTRRGENERSHTFITTKYSKIITSINETQSGVPTAYKLAQNWPNPFNPTTMIRFSLPRPSRVMLKVYNLLGEEVATLVNEKLSARTYEVEWNAAGLPSGVYLYRLQAGEFVETKKLTVLR